ncbi:MAG: insulinase family protein [Leptolyngbya sp. SIO4C5]|nr:insulinase family protein [Leptolyngbya sp. SIO4C5]
MTATPVVVTDVWVRAGAIAEPTDWAGMAHFLEHMIFKGTDRLPPGMFDAAIESRGGMTNAATSHDYAHFFLAIAADALAETLPYLADLLLHAAIPADEFVRERHVVLEEIRQSLDDPDWLGFQAMSELLYQKHPYGRPVLGTEALLNQRSPEEMRHFHQAYYQPENMTVVMVGGIALEKALEMVLHAFRPFASQVDKPVEAREALPKIKGVQRQVLQLPRLGQARLTMAWTGPGVKQLRQGYGLDLLSVLLAEGRSSRLVRELREERQLVQDISSSFSLQREGSLFTLNAWLLPEHVSMVEAIICDRLAALATDPIPPSELSRCQRLLCNDYAFSTETPGQLAGLYGYYGTIAQPEVCVTYPQTIQAYAAADLQQLAQQYLSPENYVATILQPA